MSGGAYEYAYIKVEMMADSLHRADEPLRRAFADHLRSVAKAMHAVEWVDSCDWARGEEEAAIRAVLHSGAELRAATVAAIDAQERLASLLNRADGSSGVDPGPFSPGTK